MWKAAGSEFVEPDEGLGLLAQVSDITGETTIRPGIRITSRRCQTFGRFARWETVQASSAAARQTAALAKQAQLFSGLQPRNRPNNNDPFHVTRSSSSVVTYPVMELWQIGFTCAIIAET